MKDLPKITKIEGGAAELESDAFAFDNYQTLGFLFENTEGTTLIVKVLASKDDEEPEAVPFILKNTETGESENVSADGTEITDAGAFLAVVTSGNLAHGEYDSAVLSLKADVGEIAGAFALQAEPRYSNGDE